MGGSHRKDAAVFADEGKGGTASNNEQPAKQVMIQNSKAIIEGARQTAQQTEHYVGTI